MKTGWLLVSGSIKSEKFEDLYRSLMEAATKKNIHLILKRNTGFSVDVTGGSVAGMTEFPDFIIFWDKDTALAQGFEKLHIPVFNSASAIELCDDKYKTVKALAGLDIKMPRTFKVPFVYSGMDLFDFSFLDSVEKEISYPLIVKCAKGSFGEQVHLAKDRGEALAIIHRYAGQTLIIQEYIGSDTGKGKDLRMYMTGNQCIAAIIRENQHDFRANIHLGGNGKVYQPNLLQIQLAQKIMHMIGLSFAGIDFLFGENGELILCEVNSNAHFKELYDVTGVNAARSIIDYVDANS